VRDGRTATPHASSCQDHTCQSRRTMCAVHSCRTWAARKTARAANDATRPHVEHAAVVSQDNESGHQRHSVAKRRKVRHHVSIPAGPGRGMHHVWAGVIQRWAHVHSRYRATCLHADKTRTSLSRGCVTHQMYLAQSHPIQVISLTTLLAAAGRCVAMPQLLLIGAMQRAPCQDSPSLCTHPTAAAAENMTARMTTTTAKLTMSGTARAMVPAMMESRGWNEM
jgi:hypothetical protein